MAEQSNKSQSSSRRTPDLRMSQDSLMSICGDSGTTAEKRELDIKSSGLSGDYYAEGVPIEQTNSAPNIDFSTKPSAGSLRRRRYTLGETDVWEETDDSASKGCIFPALKGSKIDYVEGELFHTSRQLQSARPTRPTARQWDAMTSHSDDAASAQHSNTSLKARARRRTKAESTDARTSEMLPPLQIVGESKSFTPRKGSARAAEVSTSSVYRHVEPAPVKKSSSTPSLTDEIKLPGLLLGSAQSHEGTGDFADGTPEEYDADSIDYSTVRKYDSDSKVAVKMRKQGMRTQSYRGCSLEPITSPLDSLDIHWSSPSNLHEADATPVDSLYAFSQDSIEKSGAFQRENQLETIKPDQQTHVSTPMNILNPLSRVSLEELVSTSNRRQQESMQTNDRQVDDSSLKSSLSDGTLTESPEPFLLLDEEAAEDVTEDERADREYVPPSPTSTPSTLKDSMSLPSLLPSITPQHTEPESMFPTVDTEFDILHSEEEYQSTEEDEIHVRSQHREASPDRFEDQSGENAFLAPRSVHSRCFVASTSCRQNRKSSPPSLGPTADVDRDSRISSRSVCSHRSVSSDSVTSADIAEYQKYLLERPTREEIIARIEELQEEDIQLNKRANEAVKKRGEICEKMVQLMDLNEAGIVFGKTKQLRAHVIEENSSFEKEIRYLRYVIEDLYQTTEESECEERNALSAHILDLKDGWTEKMAAAVRFIEENLSRLEEEESPTDAFKDDKTSCPLLKFPSSRASLAHMCSEPGLGVRPVSGYRSDKTRRSTSAPLLHLDYQEEH